MSRREPNWRRLLEVRFRADGEVRVYALDERGRLLNPLGRRRRRLAHPIPEPPGFLAPHLWVITDGSMDDGSDDEPAWATHENWIYDD
jgi:hypothetical protein